MTAKDRSRRPSISDSTSSVHGGDSAGAFLAAVARYGRLAAEAGVTEGTFRGAAYRARLTLLAHLRMHAATAQLSRSSDAELRELFARDPDYVLDAYAQNSVLSLRFRDAREVATQLAGLIRPMVGEAGLRLIDAAVDIGRRSSAEPTARPPAGAQRAIAQLRESGRSLSAGRSRR